MGNTQDHWQHQELEGGMEQVPSQSLHEESALQMTCFQTSGLQNWESIHFCCVKPTELVVICYSSPGEIIQEVSNFSLNMTLGSPKTHVTALREMQPGF